MPFLLMYKGGHDRELNTVVKDAVSSSSIHPETEKKNNTVGSSSSWPQFWKALTTVFAGSLVSTWESPWPGGQ